MRLPDRVEFEIGFRIRGLPKLKKRTGHAEAYRLVKALSAGEHEYKITRFSYFSEGKPIVEQITTAEFNRSY
jgi:hypothetical protein